MIHPMVLIAYLCSLSDLPEIGLQEGRLMNWHCRSHSSGNRGDVRGSCHRRASCQRA
jgi:hypothetical protein